MFLSKMLTLAFVVLVLVTVTGCWSQFRGGAAHTGYNPYESALTTSNVANLGVVWKGATNGRISASPAVATELINGAYTVVAYVPSEDGYLYAFNALGCGPSPTCTPIWPRFYLGGATHSSPAVATEVINGTQTSVVYVASYNGDLYAIDAAQGTQIWKTSLYGSPAYSSPAVVNGLVYVVSGDVYGAVFAFDAATGGSWIWQGGIDTNYPSPAVANGVVYAGDIFGVLHAFDASGCSGKYLCDDLWIGFDNLGSQQPFNSSPAVSNALVNGNQSPVVYVGSDDGNVYAFDANDKINCTNANGKSQCQPLWAGVTSTPFSSSSVRSSPAVANGVMYVGGTNNSGNNLYAFDANGAKNCTVTKGKTTCQPLWTGATNGGVDSSPAVANGVVYVGSSDGNLYAFPANGCNAQTCGPLGKVKTNGGIGSSPAVSTGWVYVGSSDGYLYAIEPVCNTPYCSIEEVPPVAIE